MKRIWAALRRSLFVLLVVRSAFAAAAPMMSLPLTDTRIEIDGLGWLERSRPELVRLPEKIAARVRAPVKRLAQVPSGVRLRLATDSLTVALIAEGTGTAPSPHMTAFGAGGVDLYVDGRYFGSAAPDKDGRLDKTWTLGAERRMREIVFYLPFARPLQVKELGLEADAAVKAPRSFRHPKPVVYYGSSITQGIAASNAGLTFPAIIGRELNLDFINLGFSGNGFGEPELAEAVAELDAVCFVVDYWANPTPEVYRSTLPNFIDTLRAKHPRTPIIVTGPYYNPSEEVPGAAGAGQKEKRLFVPEFVAARRKAGDTLIFYVDGLPMIDRDHADSLSDGRHPNSLGFQRIAQILGPKIAEVVGIK